MNFLRSARWSVRVAVLILALLLVIALTCQWWLPYDPQAINLPACCRQAANTGWVPTIWGAIFFPSAERHPRLLRLGHGLSSAGAVSGADARRLRRAGRRRIDQAIMRVADVFMTFPTSILSFFMVGVLGTGLTNVIIAIALSHWAWYARMVRSLVISLRSREYILAARLSGASYTQVFIDHLAGAVVPSLLVLATLDIGHMMLHVAGMSFLGLGVSAPTAEWG
jgi:nickel transport system permease protein